MVVKLLQKTKIILIITIVFSLASIATAIISLKRLNIVNIQNKNSIVMASTDNGAYYSNLDSSFMNTNSADPSMIQGPDGCFYVFATMEYSYKSCDSKTWTRWNYSFDKTLPVHNWTWAPEIYKIDNYYYLLFTLAKKGSEGNSYIDRDSKYSIYYARSTDLKNFEYLGEMPYGASYFAGRMQYTDAHIDGSLLIDNGRYYFYFPMLNKEYVLDYQGYELYGIEVKLNSNGTFSAVGDPKIIMRRNSESNPLTSNDFTWWCRKYDDYNADFENLNEGPSIVNKNGKYYLTYSVGNYDNDSYHVVSATSNNPLGPFVRDKMNYENTSNENQSKIRFFIKGYNFPSVAKTDDARDSSRYIHGPGHGSIFTLTNYDTLVGNYTEYYYIYHSNKYDSETKFSGRKLTIDGINFTDGLIFVNGPTTSIQPLISGSKIGDTYYYKLPTNKFNINNAGLKDGIKYNAMNIKKDVPTYTTNTLNISFTNNERIDLSDVWVYGNGSNIGSLSGTMYINEGTRKSVNQSFTAIVSGSTAKIQVPKVEGKVKNIRIVLNKSLVLSEVELVRNSQDNYYQVTFDPNGGTINKVGNFNTSSGYAVQNGLLMYDNKGMPSLSLAYNNNAFNILSGEIPTRSGYTFNGWYTAVSGGTKVYNANGAYNSSATSYWNNGKWIYKGDVVLYAQWSLANYTVTYNLNGGTVTGNPTSYNAGSTFTLKNPTKQGYKFTGWSGTGINGTSTSVTIPKGSTGNRSYTANFELEPLKINNYKVSGKYILGIKFNTNVSNINLGLSTGYTYKVFDKDNKQKTSEKMATGDTIKIYAGNNLHVSYRAIIKGDVTGSGTSTVGDVAKLYQYLKGKITMDEVYKEAGNVVSSDNVIKINDVAKLYQFIKGKITSLD